MRHHLAATPALLLALTGAAALPACGGKKQVAAPEPAVTAAAQPAPAAPSQLDKAATDLQALFDTMNKGQDDAGSDPAGSDPDPIATALRKPRPKPALPATPDPAPSDPGTNLEQPSTPVQGVLGTPLPGETSEPVQPLKSSTQRRAELATELAELLRQAGEDTGGVQDPVRTALPLLALETLQPGAATAELEAITRTLTPQEAKSVEALRELLRQLAGDPASAGDPAALARVLGQQADQLRAVGQTESLSIGAAALCRKVESFGRYTPFHDTSFEAGRRHTMIVYTEVANFAQTPAGQGTASSDGYLVELGQELELFHDADGSRQWHQPEAVVRDPARGKRRDYYLVQRIELPANLSVGKYNLKVTVRDKATGAEAQHALPLQIVADPRLAGQGSRRK